MDWETLWVIVFAGAVLQLMNAYLPPPFGRKVRRAKPGEVRIDGKVVGTPEEVYEAIRKKP